MIKRIILATALAAAMGGAALAGQCEDDIAKIDKALASMELAADERAQLEDMREQAQKLCSAGNVQEGLDVASEAKAMLNIE
ncbi:MAG TPA: hypothetical protein VI582_04380 [Aestuariivirga sp.]|nr:hypothetical protein [Aestuariivirga sp.]